MITTIADAVAEALHRDGRITSKTIHVTGSDREVVLHGVVDSLEEFGIAQEVAESVQGVEKVENHLSIDSEVDTGPCCPQM